MFTTALDTEGPDAPIAVDAGTHTIALDVTDVAATAVLRDASVWVIWVPFDGTGAVPTSFTHVGDPDEIDDLAEERRDN